MGAKTMYVMSAIISSHFIILMKNVEGLTLFFNFFAEHICWFHLYWVAHDVYQKCFQTSWQWVRSAKLETIIVTKYFSWIGKWAYTLPHNLLDNPPPPPISRLHFLLAVHYYRYHSVSDHLGSWSHKLYIIIVKAISSSELSSPIFSLSGKPWISNKMIDVMATSNLTHDVLKSW